MQIENKALKNYNKNLLEQINKLQSINNEKKMKENEKEKQLLDLKIRESSQKFKEEKDSMNDKISDLKKIIKEKTDKYDQLKNNFNHEYFIHQKSRLLINYLNKNNQSLESKISEMNISKENIEKK